MKRTRTLVFLLAGGAGGRLQTLTEGRAKPAVPFGGVYRLIDFPLTNCHHSGLSDVWVVQQYNPISLEHHLANGRPWDLDRTEGGLLMLHPHKGEGRSGFDQGTADSLWRNAGLIREFDPDVLLVLSADAVYRLDYADVVAAHQEGGGAVTMVTHEIDPADAGRYGVVRASEGRVTDYAYKPDEPSSGLVTNEVFAFTPRTLLDVLEELGQDVGEDGALTDLGDDVLPRLVESGQAREWRMDAYWRDVGTVDSYWEAHMDLVADPPRLDLDDASWPILTHTAVRPPARISGSTRDALVSPACLISGTVERSVLARGVVVEAGATVRDSVLLEGVRVCAGATVERAVLDEDAVVTAGAQVGDGESVALFGRGEQIG